MCRAALQLHPSAEVPFEETWVVVWKWWGWLIFLVEKEVELSVGFKTSLLIMNRVGCVLQAWCVQYCTVMSSFWLRYLFKINKLLVKFVLCEYCRIRCGINVSYNLVFYWSMRCPCQFGFCRIWSKHWMLFCGSGKLYKVFGGEIYKIFMQILSLKYTFCSCLLLLYNNNTIIQQYC